MESLLLVQLLVAEALLFGFLNGFHDSSNVVATMISSRAVSPWVALSLAAVAEFAGPFLFGVAVARTIGHDIVPPESITPEIILAALAGAIAWNLITWWFGIPSSSSHALIGGLVGAVGAAHGLRLIRIAGMTKALTALFLSPVLGLMMGYALMKLILAVARLTRASPRINWVFKRGQILTAVGLALSHGANDAQKTMGVIVMAMVATGYLPGFQVPLWVTAASAAVMAAGMASGGWRIIRTLGRGLYQIRPVHGFTAQTASAAVILGAALLGGPVSTTQVVSSSIMGVGSAERFRKVRWGVAEGIALAWLVTIPVAALMAALLYTPVQLVIEWGTPWVF